MIPSTIHLGDTVTRRIADTEKKGHRYGRLYPPGAPLLCGGVPHEIRQLPGGLQLLKIFSKNFQKFP